MLKNLKDLTLEETAKILGTLKHEWEEVLRCNSEEKWEKFKDPSKYRKMHQIKSFCNFKKSKSAPSQAHIHKDIHFLTCPCSFQDNEVYTLIQLEASFNKSGNSYIYNSEGMLKQSAKLFSCYSLIRSFISLKEQEAREAELRRIKIEQAKSRK